MRLTRVSTLLLAALLASPALYGGFVTHSLETNTALIRLLIAIPVAAIMLWLFSAVTKNFGQHSPTPATAADGPIHAEVISGEPLARRTDD